MEVINYANLVPLIILGCAPVLTLLVIAIFRNHGLTFSLSVLMLIAFVGVCISESLLLQGTYGIGNLLVIDSFGLFYMILLGITGIVILILSYPYLKRQETVREEYYLLILTALFGASVLVVSSNFVTLFLGLEILSVSLYVLIAFVKTKTRSLEGGIKYLILAAAASAFLLFGMAMIYMEAGTFSFSEMSSILQSEEIYSKIGLSMMLVGIGFKLAVVPFHMWTPDIYEGAPAPVSALIATVSKGSMIAVLLRFIHEINGLDSYWLVATLSVIAIGSMLFGNVLALRQNNVKRILAYSSIAHLGYIMIAVLSQGSISFQSATFYLVTYFLSILGAFGILGAVKSENGETEDIYSLKGLFWAKPFTAAIFAVMFFSLAGIPLTAGFMGKFYLLSAGIEEGHWILVIVLALTSVIGLYYYLRVIVFMLSQNSSGQSKSSQKLYSNISLAVLTVLAIAVIWVGIFPSDLISIIKSLSLG